MRNVQKVGKHYVKMNLVNHCVPVIILCFTVGCRKDKSEQYLYMTQLATSMHVTLALRIKLSSLYVFCRNLLTEEPIWSPSVSA